MEKLYYDVVIVGCGVAGLYTAWNLAGVDRLGTESPNTKSGVDRLGTESSNTKFPCGKKILMLSKGDLESCDSMLAQGGISVMRGEDDYGAYFEDTMRAGHYENREESVDLMLRGSRAVISHLQELGVRFDKNPDGSLAYTREGAHSIPRICFHKDITGKEITTVLLSRVRQLADVAIMEYTEMTDLIVENGRCCGITAQREDGSKLSIYASDTVLATGGIGGLYEHSTNYPLLTGDGCRIAKRHGVALAHMDYVQIHPTCLYSEKSGRSFLISESARGEGAILLNRKGERFVDELLPRDVVTKAIHEEMEKDQSAYEWLSFEYVPAEVIKDHFPNIYRHCLKEGYDILKEPIPIVPAQHYFMGGIHVDCDSHTTMPHLYAVGETSCNGVHGKNRLASNSLLESLVFAKRAAVKINQEKEKGRRTYEPNYNAACC